MALPTLRIIGFIIGIFLITLAIAMVVPMATLVIFERTSDLPSFLWASLITFIAGLALVIPGRPEHVHLRPRDMYLLTVTSWVVAGGFVNNWGQDNAFTLRHYIDAFGITAGASAGTGRARPGHRCLPR